METTVGHVRINLQSIEKELAPFGTKLLPVTKTFGPELIREAYDYGYRAFGENKVQELLPKYEALPKDIEWHLIGHLQTNKVKYIAPFIGVIESVDSEKLLAEIDKQAAKNNRTIRCLLQVYIATEESKFGWSPEELKEWIDAGNLSKYPNVKIEGLMGMASFSSDEALVRREFQTLKKLFDELRMGTVVREDTNHGGSEDTNHGRDDIRMGTVVREDTNHGGEDTNHGGTSFVGVGGENTTSGKNRIGMAGENTSPRFVSPRTGTGMVLENTNEGIEMKTLSIGMSGDYTLACEAGSTVVRMGTAIFGKR